MKKRLLLITLVSALFLSVSTQAQFRLGIKAGTNISNFSISGIADTFDAENITSFTGGLTFEYISSIGLGLDFGAMYTRMGSKLSNVFDTEQKHIDYIEVPINLRYKLSAGRVGRIIAPFAYIGPSLSFRVGDNFKDMIKSKSFGTSINAGVGLELFRHLQLSVQHGWGLTNAMSVEIYDMGEEIKGKNRAWTITAALLF